MLEKLNNLDTYMKVSSGIEKQAIFSLKVVLEKLRRIAENYFKKTEKKNIIPTFEEWRCKNPNYQIMSVEEIIKDGDGINALEKIATELEILMKYRVHEKGNISFGKNLDLISTENKILFSGLNNIFSRKELSKKLILKTMIGLSIKFASLARKIKNDPFLRKKVNSIIAEEGSYDDYNYSLSNRLRAIGLLNKGNYF